MVFGKKTQGICGFLLCVTQSERGPSHHLRTTEIGFFLVNLIFQGKDFRSGDGMEISCSDPEFSGCAPPNCTAVAKLRVELKGVLYILVVGITHFGGL